MSPSRDPGGGRSGLLSFKRHPGVGKDGQPLTPSEPRKATSGSAGLDLFIPQTVVIPPGLTMVIDLLFSFVFPPGTYGQLHLRSSASGLGLGLRGGVIGK